ncbi:MAG: T9SS type A sorting domain-containing protein [Bacteroidetes bacterium]|nr:T9SS type A sorting domain-containing protein [Bacteroidota bacterium]
MLDGGNELVIKDYAYELLPDVPIIAGDTVGRIVEFAHDTIPQFGTGLPDADNEVSNAIIYSFGSTVYIRAHGLNGDASVNIYNITGETVYIGSMNNDFLNVEMTQPSGIYLVELIADKQRTCRKVILD